MYQTKCVENINNLEYFQLPKSKNISSLVETKTKKIFCLQKADFF